MQINNFCQNRHLANSLKNINRLVTCFQLTHLFYLKKIMEKNFQVCKKKGYNSLCYDMSIAFLILTLKFCFSRYYFAVLEGERGRLKYGFGCSGAPNWNILTNPMLLLKKLTNLLDNTYTLDILFPSNHNIHKSSSDHCFWASDHLIDGFY